MEDIEYIQRKIKSLCISVSNLQIADPEYMFAEIRPLIRAFPLAQLKLYQYLHGTQLVVVNLFRDLQHERSERLKLSSTIIDLEVRINELEQQRERRNPSKPPPVPFSVEAPNINSVDSEWNILERPQFPQSSVETTLILMGDSKPTTSDPSSTKQTKFIPKWAMKKEEQKSNDTKENPVHKRKWIALKR